MRLLIRSASFLAAVTAPLLAVSAAPDNAGLRIDVPVVLTEAKVVFNLDHAAFNGDEPIGLNFLRIMMERFQNDGTKAQIVAVFHGALGYVALDDAVYDRVRHWQHGNPYKDQIATLQRAGVQFEICGETMIVNQWRNDELLPGIKTNTGANFRVIQLVQQGFIQLQP